MEYLTFIELPSFSKRKEGLLTEDDLQELQLYLLENHQNAPYIQGTGGCQKIRWAREGQGKSSSVRVIYYCVSKKGRLYLMLVYPKNVQDNLTAQQKAQLKSVLKLLDQEA
ncbi:type II toxin-antitoxin system RelE/ParE family toxin [[Haemophilus] felis]|nr:type II toxin-antitoxin system RelE/ParE family toxin [[Haemophilus] felis]